MLSWSLRTEKLLEKLMYATGWLLALVYLGLSLVLLILAIKFFQEILHVLPAIFALSEADLVLVSLSLVDLTLVASLIIMVMFSSYENFVSRLDIEEPTESSAGSVRWTPPASKTKWLRPYVAISSIHLLKVFMDTQKTPPETLKWYIIIHPAFVFCAFAMGMLDKMAKHN